MKYSRNSRICPRLTRAPAHAQTLRNNPHSSSIRFTWRHSSVNYQHLFICTGFGKLLQHCIATSDSDVEKPIELRSNILPACPTCPTFHPRARPMCHLGMDPSVPAIVLRTAMRCVRRSATIPGYDLLLKENDTLEGVSFCVKYDTLECVSICVNYDYLQDPVLNILLLTVSFLLGNLNEGPCIIFSTTICQPEARSRALKRKMMMEVVLSDRIFTPGPGLGSEVTFGDL